MKVLVVEDKEMDTSILEKFDHLSLYYIFHFLYKKLKFEKFDSEIKNFSKEKLIEIVREATINYI